MRIVVDARLLRGGGIGRYVREITSRWLTSPDVREIRFLGDVTDLGAWLEGRRGADRATLLHWRDPVYGVRAQLRWAREAGRWCDGCDAFFVPHWDAPAVRTGPPRLLTVHDLTHFLEPEGFPWWKRIPGRWLLGRALGSSEGLVTVSRATLSDLEARFPEAGARCRVIPNGVSHWAFRPLEGAEVERAQERWGEHVPFLLLVGPLKPHKAGGTALRALRAVARERPEVRLLQVGPKEVRDPEVARLLEDPEIAARFFQAGVLDDERLNEVYGVSECLLHPARREGFGLPPLEAMASGTPVVASNRSSVPEVTGEAAVLLDPDDPEAWGRAVLELLGSPASREARVRRGRARARRFSWERTAAETLEALREVAGGRPEPSGGAGS